MSDSAYVFVDNSNVWIQGKRLSGERFNLPENNRYRIDYGKLLQHVLGTRTLAAVPRLYGSEPPPNDSVWRMIAAQGFDVHVFRRNIRNKEKGVDMQMGLDIQRLIFTQPMQTVIMVAGDADFVPVCEELRSAGWSCEVWYWSRAAQDLKAAACAFHSLDAALNTIGFEA